jgi:uncharacterized protein
MQVTSSNNTSSQQLVLDAIKHLNHVLPGQGPIHDFVHHNTLHGFQHLPFEQALSDFSQLTGIDCYLPVEQFRAFYQQGRISDEDLDDALEQQFALSHQPELAKMDQQSITQRQLYRLALLNDLPSLSPAQLQWQLQELTGLNTKNGQAAHDLWEALLSKLELSKPDEHPEQLLDLSIEQARSWLTNTRQHMQQQANQDRLTLFAKVGDSLTLRGLVQILTGVDILDSVRPLLIRLSASILDEGMAAWRLPQRQSLGLYQAWLQSAEFDVMPVFQELTDWKNLKTTLPEDAVEAIIQQLQALAIPKPRWAGYLQRLALELPGWSGLINWRQVNPHYQADDNTQPLLADYLAIRLILDRLYLQQLCHQQWRCQAKLDKLQAYFAQHSAEFAVRRALFSGELPEYLTQASQSLLAHGTKNPQEWQSLAERIWTWQHSPLATQSGKVSVYNHGWRLFQLCRQLALSSPDLQQLSNQQLLDWLAIIDQFSDAQRRKVWLHAYERHYQQDLLQALHANHGRGHWLRRDTRPQAQIYFCMDEREESFRRHLEELNPAIETLGVAGFFGIAMNYQGLDAHHVTPLCPVVVTPSHQINEVIQPGHDKQYASHRKGLHQADGLAYQLYQNLRRSLLWAYPLAFAFAPLQLLRLLGKSCWPTWQRHLEQAWQRWLVPQVATQLQFIADAPTPATPTAPRVGFTDQEQTDRVASFLKTTGLTYGFARLVTLMGHGSTSQNNPHEAAHDCGACGGRQGGANARAFAAMANRPVVRQLLIEQGIVIPEDTWFIGAQHDTCSDIITWYDLDQMPAAWQTDFANFQACLTQADRLAAAERCRRFASASQPVSAKAAIRHVENRSMDLSQVRPEFGHATNAAAFIGRRSATQGAFFDRRLFLISYDPSQDPEGTILENILLTAGPVGAGINLEYYFSSVNNDRLGCGTKIPHNVTGLFGVMEGTGSDLRTGLPLQMVEIHEAMRLQIVVEAKTAVLEQIYARQPDLQDLIGGGWVHLSAQDPESGEMFVFQRGTGFAPWQPQNKQLPLRENSSDCFRDSTQAVAPMLIKQVVFAGEQR